MLFVSFPPFFPPFVYCSFLTFWGCVFVCFGFFFFPTGVFVFFRGGGLFRFFNLGCILNGPESAHKNGILKTFTHTSTPIQPCTLLKQRKSKTANSPNMTPSFICPLPVQCGGGRRPGSLADAPQDCSTSEDFLPRTVLIQNVSRCIHQILHHCPATTPFLTTSTITFSCLASAAPQADS